MSTEKVHIMIKRWTKQISAVDFVLFIGIINLCVVYWYNKLKGVFGHEKRNGGFNDEDHK